MAVYTAMNRIKRELLEVGRDGAEGGAGDGGAGGAVAVRPRADTWAQLRGDISGPPDTPYEGGRFLLDIDVPPAYPFEPPKVRFVTRLWHPNVSSATGAICLDILKDEWAATMTLRTMLLSLQALLCAPEPDDPQDAVVATQYKSDPNLFAATAGLWTHLYAGGPHAHPDLQSQVTTLTEMGVDHTRAVIALSSCHWDMQKATDFLFS